MFKRGGGISLFGRQNWKRRYFVLKGYNLYYYKNQEAFVQGKSYLKQPINLERCKIERKKDTDFNIVFLQNKNRYQRGILEEHLL